MAYLVEINTLFLAADLAEAETLLDQVVDTELKVVCPPDTNRLEPCSHCTGSLVNPIEDGDEEAASSAPDDARWAPGAPCVICADTEHPGREMPCAREHTAGATIHSDGQWITQADRQASALLRRLLAALDTDGPEATRVLIEEALTDLEDTGSPHKSET